MNLIKNIFLFIDFFHISTFDIIIIYEQKNIQFFSSFISVSSFGIIEIADFIRKSL